MSPSELRTFKAIHTYLKETYPPPLFPPTKPRSGPLRAQIASLQVHPTLEAALHILNNDLPSAHFLVRHMQSAPAVEGMFLHGILHRVEGDYDNARLWYSDVQKGEDVGKNNDVYVKVWGSGGKGFKELGEAIRDVQFRERKEFGRGGGREMELNDGQRFLNSVQAMKEQKVKTRDADEEERLLHESRRETEGVIEWCVHKFGDGKLEDASGAWVKNSEEIQKMSDDQVQGNSGHRKF